MLNPPGIAQNTLQSCARLARGTSQASWAWLGELGTLKTEPGCRGDVLRSESEEPLRFPGVKGECWAGILAQNTLPALKAS